jgi:hypothetical protein
MTSLPLDPDAESALLADFLNPSFTLLDLSERHQISLPDLVAWAELPATADLLIRLKRLADDRAALLAAEQSPAAVSTLSAAALGALTTAADAPDVATRLRALESARKAAAPILRAGRSRKPTAASEPIAETDPAQAEPADAEPFGADPHPADPPPDSLAPLSACLDLPLVQPDPADEETSESLALASGP